MSKLKEIIKKGLNTMDTKQIIEQLIQNDNHNETKEYETQGFRDAAKADGSPEAYLNSVDHFYASILLKQKEDLEQIQKKNQEIEKSINELQQKKIIKSDELKKLKENDLPKADEEFKKAEQRLYDFMKNPQEFVREDKDSFMQWIYGLITLALAVFLYFFYTSVVYSAVFRDVTISKFTLYNSIFYPRAIEEAFAKGFTAFMLTIFAPFIFYAMGFFAENEKKRSVGKNFRGKLRFFIPLIFAFLLDALFAYHISERIYNSKAINSYENLKPYTFSDAITDLNFWIIIALGFCVYLLFGYMFGLYNELRTNSSKYEKVKMQLETEKERAKSLIDKIKEKITLIEDEIKHIDLRIAELQKDFNKIFYSPIEIKNILSVYTRGWINFLRQGRYPESYIRIITDELNNFYQKIGEGKDEK
ncbi:MAG: hypothetical protein N3F03_05430 [Ignavibacteria bacterium]|nr:hypothetical protein [Ignavibacteria bacterium]